jgi:hypothetical protein
MRLWSSALKLSAVAALGLGLAAHPSDARAEKYKVFLSMSYIGNDWQAEAPTW